MDAKINLLLGGATAAAVIAGIYVLWDPSGTKKKRKRDICPGLYNTGNTCFLNAILQAFAPYHALIQWLGDFIDQRIQYDYRQYLAFTLITVLKKLNNQCEEESDVYSSTDVLAELRRRRWTISSEEQDAHELFQVVTQTLEEETSRYASNMSLLDMDSLEQSSLQCQPVTRAYTRTKALLPVLPSKNTAHPFRGRLASQLQCKRCGHKCPVKYDTFDSLSLSFLPPSNNGHSMQFWSKFEDRPNLDKLLRYYIESETVQNVECEGCAKLEKKLQSSPVASKPKTTYLKKLTIGKLPQCLCVHIQRTIWMNNGMPIKRHDHVAFPEYLDMNEYVFHKRKEMDLRKESQQKSTLHQNFIGKHNGVTHLSHLNGFCNTQKKQIDVVKEQSQCDDWGITEHVPSSRGDLPSVDETDNKSSANKCSRINEEEKDKKDIPKREDTLSISEKIIRDRGKDFQYNYILVAVVVHLGDVFSGHFVTYRRAVSSCGEYSRKWLYTSDELVRRATLNEVLDANAYMLFYERV